MHYEMHVRNAWYARNVQTVRRMKCFAYECKFLDFNDMKYDLWIHKIA